MIGDALRMIRVFHDLSQKDAAEKLEIAPSFLSEIEKGKKKPTLDLLKRYANEFKMPVSSIMFFSEEMANASRSEKLRLTVSSKVLSLLQMVAARAGKDAA
ncbi:helix-turn-helix transcriptional regulator [Acetobacter sp.]|jgi:transcriptional regulator with XRE-family HTH domain|uniref:helix-turn-helix transcriptional regulator n=1 Tax=Acetobacter sp. TaxID=440 RepID=UPI0025C6F212|nr:helix-turn-helix transcriptional regulator [Acetobacter sp.]MCH4091856.1 helix-turn-helix domain-containing protein [Acetobacter sp.]